MNNNIPDSQNDDLPNRSQIDIESLTIYEVDDLFNSLPDVFSIDLVKAFADYDTKKERLFRELDSMEHSRIFLYENILIFLEFLKKYGGISGIYEYLDEHLELELTKSEHTAINKLLKLLYIETTRSTDSKRKRKSGDKYTETRAENYLIKSKEITPKAFLVVSHISCDVNQVIGVHSNSYTSTRIREESSERFIIRRAGENEIPNLQRILEGEREYDEWLKSYERRKREQ